MPYDGTFYEAIDLTELQPGEAGLRQLAYLLRHPEKWPEGHVWSFTKMWQEQECGTTGCAFGLVEWKWGRGAYDFKKLDLGIGGYKNEAAIFGTDHNDATKCYGVGMEQVTPTMVADAIDFYLATGRVPVAGEATP